MTKITAEHLARGALDVLAELQATEDDPSIDAEPGKIVHEVRRGKAAETWFRRYYGTADATPLYLVSKPLQLVKRDPVSVLGHPGPRPGQPPEPQARR